MWTASNNPSIFPSEIFLARSRMALMIRAERHMISVLYLKYRVAGDDQSNIAWLHTVKHTSYAPKIVADKPLCPQIMPPILKPNECVEWHNEPSSVDLVSFEVYNRIIVV